MARGEKREARCEIGLAFDLDFKFKKPSDLREFGGFFVL